MFSLERPSLEIFQQTNPNLQFNKDAEAFHSHLLLAGLQYKLSPEPDLRAEEACEKYDDLLRRTHHGPTKLGIDHSARLGHDIESSQILESLRIN